MDEQRTMCAAILSDFCGDSEAFGMAAIHTDKRGNPHAHFLFVDGLESIAAAKARRPDAQRVRRADALRLNEGGNRQEVRERIAATINAVAAPAGRRLAEVRSFKERGIDREPQRHEGPQVADKLAREPDRPTFTRRVYNRLKSNADALRKRLQRDTIEGASIDPDDIPSRYRKGWIGTALRDWRQRVSAERTKGQDLTAVQMVDDGCAAFVASWSEQEPPAATMPPFIANPPPAPSDHDRRRRSGRPSARLYRKRRDGWAGTGRSEAPQQRNAPSGDRSNAESACSWFVPQTHLPTERPPLPWEGEPGALWISAPERIRKEHIHNPLISLNLASLFSYYSFSKTLLFLL